jgi:hypothetical protein
MKARPVRKLPSALTLKAIDGRQVALSCACGFLLRQPIRDPIAPACPSCGRTWR